MKQRRPESQERFVILRHILVLLGLALLLSSSSSPNDAVLVEALSFQPKRLECFHRKGSFNIPLLPQRFPFGNYNNRPKVHTQLWDSSPAELELSTETQQQLTASLETNVNIPLQQPSLLSTHDDVSVSPRVGETVLTSNGTTLELDVPQPTLNGGFSHTSASKAKISAANKGKSAWNKGVSRSDEVRARISAGVRAKNRERFLKKIAEMGLTEEEYKAQEKEKKDKIRKERQSRRTEKGGYRPTAETKEKISKRVKARKALGTSVKRKPVHPSKVRRGFTHSAETRAKISASLKKRWANDEVYRTEMKKKANITNKSKEMRAVISAKLKQKWTEPEFREAMMEKMRDRKAKRIENGDDFRQKISIAIKKKWQDPEYRKKTVAGIRERNAELAKLRPPKKPRTPRAPRKPKRLDEPKRPTASVAEPFLRAREARKRTRRTPRRNTDGTPTKRRKKKPGRKRKIVEEIVLDDDYDDDEILAGSGDSRKRRRRSKVSGSISRLRDERRDLYDLLYGDDEASPLSEDVVSDSEDDLDTFDPYGLDD